MIFRVYASLVSNVLRLNAAHHEVQFSKYDFLTPLLRMENKPMAKAFN